MFGMYEFDSSCFKRFFQSILCQMSQSFYRNNVQNYILQERVKFGHVTDHDILIY